MRWRGQPRASSLGLRFIEFRPRNCRSSGIKFQRMIRIALTDATYETIASTLPKGAARWPMQRQGDQCFIQVEAAVVDRLRTLRRPGECYSNVILRLVELESEGGP